MSPHTLAYTGGTLDISIPVQGIDEGETATVRAAIRSYPDGQLLAEVTLAEASPGTFSGLATIPTNTEPQTKTYSVGISASAGEDTAETGPEYIVVSAPPVPPPLPF